MFSLIFNLCRMNRIKIRRLSTGMLDIFSNFFYHYLFIFKSLLEIFHEMVLKSVSSPVNGSSKVY